MTQMGWPWHASLHLLLAAGVVAEPIRRTYRLPWPDPVPASAVGPVDWSSIRAPVYSAPASRGRNGKSLPGTAAILASSDAGSPLPAVVDWRNRSGINYITTAQDQGVCESCWAFAATALIESMVRIEHGAWSKRSEADVHGGIGATCQSVGNAADTLSYVAGIDESSANDPEATPPGIADWPCDPYEAADHPYLHCADRSGRATHISTYQALGSVAEQKRWLDQYGPIIATFVLYADFSSWKPASPDIVYAHDGVSQSTGNHLALLVGYDDEKQAWIMKNSWGTGWGHEGFVYFAYGNANIDSWTKYGLANVNPDPWTRKRHQSGSMMASGNGWTHRNFELLLANPNGPGITHISRDGDSTEWSVVTEVPEANSVLVGQPAIIGTSFNRDFHAVAVDEQNTLRQWVYSQSEKRWSQFASIQGYHIDGYPGLVQSDGSQLVMVVKHADGTLNEWQQAPNSTTWTLTYPPIAHNISQSGPALVQSNVGLDMYDPQGSSQGNLYTVAVRGDGRMQLFWRSGGGEGGGWSAGEVFGAGVPADTPPVMIQDFFDTANETSVGGFQLAVAVNGTVQHWERVNDDLDARPPLPGVGDGQGQPRKWRLVESAGRGVKRVWALVQGSFNQRMHMITEGVDGVFSYWEWDGRWEVVQALPPLSDPSWARTEPVSGG